MNIEGIQPRPLSEVGPMFAEFLGKDWEASRQEIVDLVNEFRESLYLHPDLPKLFTHKFYCIRPCCYPMSCSCTCSSDCADTFRGFTLPSDIESIEGAWEDAEPLRLHSSWWEGRTGRKSNNTEPTISLLDTGHISPTRRPMREPGPISIYTECNADDDKTLVIKALDCWGEVTEHLVKLQGGGVVETEDLFGIYSITLPQIEGHVRLSVGDYELSTYSRYDNRVPQYKIIKVNTGSCGCDKILIHGNQRFAPIWFDTDIVEVGSRIIIREAVNALKYGREGSDQKELQRALIAENKMIRLIKSALKRSKGGMTQDGHLFRPPRRRFLNTGDLRGYGNRRYT